MERYQEYQDSGVEWIGEIPKGWKVEKLKYLATIMNGQDYKNIIADEGYPVIGSGGIFATATKYLYDGESVLLGRKGTIDKPIYIKGAFWTVDTMYYTVINDVCLPKLLYYLCTQIRFDYYQYGSAVPSMTSKDLNNIKFSLPDVNEQQAIVSYLDAKCAVIDSEIARRQDIIAKCQEYRQSLIAETVTRGLDPAAPLRDSGVEWIGKIPKGWKVEKLKYTLVEKKDAVKVGPFGSQLKGNDFAQEGVPVYNQRTVLDNDFKNGESFISEEKYKILKSFSVNPNDILLTTRGTIGKVAIVPDDVAKGIIHPCIIKFTLNMELLLCEFLAYVFNDTQIVYQQLLLFSNATTIPVVYSESLKNIALTVPPLATQQAIVSYLDTKCAEIDGIIKNNTEVVGKLEELKKSLIFEVVTGKRRIG